MESPKKRRLRTRQRTQGARGFIESWGISPRPTKPLEPLWVTTHKSRRFLGLSIISRTFNQPERGARKKTRQQKPEGTSAKTSPCVVTGALKHK